MFAGVLFHFTTFSCLEKNGPLNMQIVSNVRAVVETFLAYYLSVYLFYDVYPGVLNWWVGKMYFKQDFKKWATFCRRLETFCETFVTFSKKSFSEKK